MPNGMPFGDAFLVQTPALDNYGLQLYQEERRRQDIARQEEQQLNQMMTSEMGKIRSADTPEFIAQYEKYKTIKKQLYNPKVQRNATEVNRINQQAAEELAKAMQLATASAELKDRLKLLNAERTKNPAYFNDDFMDRYQAAFSTPLSKLSKHEKYGDLSNIESFYYQGNVTNLQPLFDKAKGTLRVAGDPDVNENYSPLEREVTKYKAYNSPRQYYNNLVGSLRGQRAQKDLVTSFNYTPEEEQKIIETYEKEVVNNPLYQKVYGKEELNFPQSAMMSEAGKLSMLMAMEHAIGAIQSERKTERKVEAIMNKQQANKESNMRLASRLGVGAFQTKYVFAKEAEANGVTINEDNVGEMIENAVQPDGKVNIEPKVMGLPDYATNVKRSRDGKTITYEVQYEGAKEPETKSVTTESVKKYMVNYLDVPRVPRPAGAGTKPAAPKPTGTGNKKRTLNATERRNQ